MSSTYDQKSFEAESSKVSEKNRFYGAQSVGGRSRQSRLNLSKTGNEVKLNGLKAEDEYKENVPFVQDEFNRQDVELQQFTQDRVKKT